MSWGWEWVVRYYWGLHLQTQILKISKFSKAEKDSDCEWPPLAGCLESALFLDSTQSVTTLLFLEILVGFIDCCGTFSVQDISLQSSQRGSGPDPALPQRCKYSLKLWLCHGESLTEQRSRAPWMLCIWLVLLHSHPFLSKRPAYSRKAPCWGQANITWPWIVQILWRSEMRGSLCSHQTLNSCKGMGLF